MKSTTQFCAFLLFCLFVLVGLSLLGARHLQQDSLSASPTVSEATGTANQEDEQTTAHIRVEAAWMVAAQSGCLLLCAALCVSGLLIWHRATREASAKEHAERELDRERRALERRVEERTRELRQEVEERRRAEELNRGHKQVLEMLASPDEQKTEDILRHLTATIAAQRRIWECSLHLLDSDGTTLRLVASSEVGEKLKRYLLNIGANFPDAPESRACESGKTYIVEKMTDIRRPWSELLVANGIFSAWSVPFRSESGGAVIGTLTVYSRLQNTPSPREIELLETAANLASLVIAHRRIHAELVHNAYQDALTGLPNRRAGELAIASAIEKASRKSESVGVLWVDLNRFKRVNDQHGHAAGDHVLCTIADRIGRHPLVTGGAARMGGDEFLVLITGDAAQGHLDEVARQLGETIAEPISIAGSSMSITASIGICVYPRDGSVIDLLERNADFAMYRAKSAGSATCIYSPTFSKETKEALEIEEALAVALEEGTLRVFYQPLYTAEGRLYAFEALARFHHPKLGNIPPSRFIPIAEDTRLICSIGSWILRESCRQVRQWHAAGLPQVRVGVNISALQFVRDDFAESVAATLADCELTPEHLVLELTESVVMEDNGAVVRQMNLLKQCGIRIAMDDFGTGYSSLSYIHKLPIDVLKIDRSFIERIAEPEGTRPIVEAIIAMARHLGLSTIAEGVETAEQRQILQQAGCQAFQGYYFGRPMPPEEAERLLASSNFERRFPRRGDTAELDIAIA